MLSSSRSCAEWPWEPPGIEAERGIRTWCLWWTSSGLFNPCHDELAIDLFSIEFHFVTGLDGYKQRGIARLKDHCHARVHPEFFDRTMFDRDLGGRLIDPRDLAVNQS